jgi:hypothetical protein
MIKADMMKIDMTGIDLIIVEGIKIEWIKTKWGIQKYIMKQLMPMTNYLREISERKKMYIKLKQEMKDILIVGNVQGI